VKIITNIHSLHMTLFHYKDLSTAKKLQEC